MLHCKSTDYQAKKIWQKVCNCRS